MGAASFPPRTQGRRSAARRLGCTFIFHRDGRPIAEFRKSWASACRAAGVMPGRAGLTFHDLRRTGLRNLVRAGVSQHVAMAISGHKTPSTFRRYDITSDEDLREAMEKTSAYLEGLPTTSNVHALARRESGGG
jgi:integrase